MGCVALCKEFHLLYHFICVRAESEVLCFPKTMKWYADFLPNVVDFPYPNLLPFVGCLELVCVLGEVLGKEKADCSALTVKQLGSFFSLF